MRAIVRSVQSLDGELGQYAPDHPGDDGVWIRFLIGPVDSEGEESFDVLICTPSWLGRLAREEGPQVGRHRLIVDRLELPKAVAFLRHQFESLEGDNWDDLAMKLSRVGFWEFEDYRPS